MVLDPDQKLLHYGLCLVTEGIHRHRVQVFEEVFESVWPFVREVALHRIQLVFVSDLLDNGRFVEKIV